MQMFPHERSLVKRMQDRPFALIGVNADRDRDEALKRIDKDKINWRSFFDEGGKIAKSWHVRGYPTIYVLDHHGVIRYREVRDRDMDEAVEALLKEAEKK